MTDDIDLTNLRRICRICFCLLVLMTVAMTIITIVCVLGLVLIYLDPGSCIGGYSHEISLVKMFNHLMVSISMVFTQILAARIFWSVSRNYSPFTPRNADDMGNMAIILVVFFVITPLIQFIMMSLMEPGTSYIPDIATQYLAIATVIYCLSLVFRYGAALQRQSDETL